MSVIVFIPLRGGSKSIKNKNLLNINGKPLLQYVIDSSVNSGVVDRIIVATDSDEIEEVILSLNYSIIQIYRRLELNARDTSTTESVVLEFFDSIHCDLIDSDILLLLQATSPQCKSDDIAGALDYFSSNNFDSVLSAVKFNRFFWDSSGKALNYNYRNRPRRQDILMNYFVENGAIYISKVGNFKEHQNRLNGNIGIFEMSEDSLIELDEIKDINLIENVLRLRNVNQFKSKIACNIKLFLSDIDGTLTDSGMYYDKCGESLKKFNTRDGHAFKLFKEKNILTGVVTSEISLITKSRFVQKLDLDYVMEGVSGVDKLLAVQNLCCQIGISMDEVAYIGDDLNCIELLKSVGLKSCPSDAHRLVKDIPGIVITKFGGGGGCVREFAEYILEIDSL